ncbi:SLC13 family permease [Polyangium jinanense]|uniref:Arsenic transporter n=1 Tax=Polyangium jinanense TaxID=2829994 RepID=A0A9X3X309_9BACT|nr:SLC13 family permease [Polyangium jinanense]MDC3952882.1 arsenic transporter [Polyangium jinanense]MDC3980501.1 arsenic transporter [Polyangium jinanense]
MSHLPTLVVFIATYVLIAFRRLSLLPIGRPAGALAGACMMVVLASIEPRWGIDAKTAFAAVEPNTIGLLLGMMLLSAALAEAGFFERAASFLLERKPSPVGLLYGTTIASGLLSAVLVNDPVCVLFAPVVDATARKAGLPRVPYLLALAMGANAGSAMTLAGNPQNMLVAHLSGLSYRSYLLRGGPAGFLALLVTAATLHLLFRKRLRPTSAAQIDADVTVAPRSRSELMMALVVILGVSIAFLAGANLAFAALTGAAALLVLRRRDPASLFSGVTWTVLVFFGALFIVAAAFQRTGLVDETLAAARPFIPEGRGAAMAALSAMFTLGCQVVSNVPFILLAEPMIRTLPDPTLAWTVTAMATTLAGNLTLLGSVANIIVVEAAHAEDEIGFVTYLRAGLPVTIVSMVVAIGYLLLVG